MNSFKLYVVKIAIPYHMLFFLLFIYHMSGQHINEIDTTTHKKKLEYQLRKALDGSFFSKALSITDSMQSYCIKNKDSTFLAFSYEAKVALYEYQRNIPKAKEYIIKSIKAYNRKQHHNAIVNLNIRLASILRSEGKLDSCLYLLNKISKDYISDSIPKETLQIFYNQKEISQYFAGRIDSSLHYTFKRLYLIDKNDNYKLGSAYIALSGIFKRVNDKKKALHYINIALDYLLKNKNQFLKSQCEAYLIKASILIKTKQYQEALLNIKNAENTIQNQNRPNEELRIRILKFKILQKQNPSKLPAKLDAINLDPTKIGSLTLFDFYLTKLSKATSDMNWEEASSLIKEIDAIYSSVSNLNLKQDFHKFSSQYWEGIKEFKKSNDALKQYLKIKEKINTQQQTYMAYDLDQKYQLAKKNEEISKQNFMIKEQENQLVLKEKQQTYLAASIISVLVAFILLFLIYKQHQRLKNNEILALQHKHEIVKLESLIQGEEKERKRLAQDLHDGINGDLSAIKYKITSMDLKKMTSEEKKNYGDAISLLDHTVEQVRLISHNLAPSSLQNFDLTEAIRQFCYKINDANNVDLRFQYYGTLVILCKEKENAIYRIIQELVNNIVKHAKASEALVQINNHQNRLHITVEDNGVGFDVDKQSKGIGLENIKSRINFLSGTLGLQSNEDGTSVYIDIDLNKVA